MYIDTHCHLNFKAFAGGEAKIMQRAQAVGVESFIVPGTDYETSRIAVAISQDCPEAFAVVGIHPHHASQYKGNAPERSLSEDLTQIETWIKEPKVVGIGEIGLDRHAYTESRYGPLISIDDSLLDVQKELFEKQVRIAASHNKSVVIHNREASIELIELCRGLESVFASIKDRGVLHCCEPDDRLLELAKELSLYIGVDGDVTYAPEKQDFIRKVPLDMLVLETDSPYILPEPLRSARKYPNTPATIPLIAQKVAEIHGVELNMVAEVTTRNAKKLFDLPK